MTVPYEDNGFATLDVPARNRAGTTGLTARVPAVYLADPATGEDVAGPSTACSITSVGDAAISTELLAANTARKSARIVNDSTAILYVACTEAASATNYTARLNQYDAVTIDGFTGAIYGLWASDAGGNARISEFS